MSQLTILEYVIINDYHRHYVVKWSKAFFDLFLRHNCINENLQDRRHFFNHWHRSTKYVSLLFLSLKIKSAFEQFIWFPICSIPIPYSREIHVAYAILLFLWDQLHLEYDRNQLHLYSNPIRWNSIEHNWYQQQSKDSRWKFNELFEEEELLDK